MENFEPAAPAMKKKNSEELTALVRDLRKKGVEEAKIKGEVKKFMKRAALRVKQAEAADKRMAEARKRPREKKNAAKAMQAGASAENRIKTIRVTNKDILEMMKRTQMPKEEIAAARKKMADQIRAIRRDAKKFKYTPRKK